jgi:site-specific DNA-methyltransferase (adenine-specific)
MNFRRNTVKSNETTLFQEEREGHILEMDEDLEFQMFYRHTNGSLWLGDSIKWLKSLESESVDLIFADPPYNIKKADWDTFESQAQYIDWSMQWVVEAARILKKTGTLYICGFSEILADLKHPTSKHFKSCRWIVWHYKNKANFRPFRYN